MVGLSNPKKSEEFFVFCFARKKLISKKSSSLFCVSAFSEQNFIGFCIRAVFILVIGVFTDAHGSERLHKKFLLKSGCVA